jgi:hypothetical protein
MMQESVRELSQALKLNSLFTFVAYNRRLKDNESVSPTPSLKDHLSASVLAGTLPNADLKIITEKGVEVSAHSSVLIQRSEYFRRMLGASWIESELKTIHMEEVLPHSKIELAPA